MKKNFQPGKHLFLVSQIVLNSKSYFLRKIHYRQSAAFIRNELWWSSNIWLLCKVQNSASARVYVIAMFIRLAGHWKNTTRLCSLPHIFLEDLISIKCCCNCMPLIFVHLYVCVWVLCKCDVAFFNSPFKSVGFSFSLFYNVSQSMATVQLWVLL